MHSAARTFGAGRALARLFWALVVTLSAAVLAIARSLEPDPSGIGTHLQLGLPPCGFLLLSEFPCPACGLTTAFAHMARLEFASAAAVHPVGVALFLCTVAALPVGSWGCVAGWPVEDALKRLRAGRLAAIIGLSAVLSWIARLAVIHSV